MNEKSVRDQLREQTKLMELGEEYQRLAENEDIYLSETVKWRKLKQISFYGYLLAVTVTLGLVILLPIKSISGLDVWFQLYPFHFVCFWIFFLCSTAAPILSVLSTIKISKISDELEPSDEESLYLRAYETYSNLQSLLQENTNPKRKAYFKNLALGSVQELVDVADNWKLGNVHLVDDLVGNRIDLLKNNMKRLIMSNIAKGEDSVLKQVSENLIEFCKYLRSPSVEKLEELNKEIEGLPFVEYKPLRRRERLVLYLSGKPRFFRLLFAGGTTTAFAVILWCLNLSLAVIIAVAVPCFWGAFSGFDKLIGKKE